MGPEGAAGFFSASEGFCWEGGVSLLSSTIRMSAVRVLRGVF